jgi:hypothetical protein
MEQYSVKALDAAGCKRTLFAYLIYRPTAASFDLSLTDGFQCWRADGADLTAIRPSAPSCGCRVSACTGCRSSSFPRAGVGESSKEFISPEEDPLPHFLAALTELPSLLPPGAHRPSEYTFEFGLEPGSSDQQVSEAPGRSG